MTATAPPPMPHLADRPEALEPLGWTGADAEWLALVCLHSGVFTRAQYRHRFDVGHTSVHRFVRRLVEAGVAADHLLPGTRQGTRLCHVFGRGLYRALGVEHIRHRRHGTEGVIFRRLLSLDLVMERPDLPGSPPSRRRWPASRSSGSMRTPFRSASTEAGPAGPPGATST